MKYFWRPLKPRGLFHLFVRCNSTNPNQKITACGRSDIVFEGTEALYWNERPSKAYMCKQCAKWQGH